MLFSCAITIDENDLTGTVPLELGDMNKLKELDICEYTSLDWNMYIPNLVLLLQVYQYWKKHFYWNLIYFPSITAENDLTGSVVHLCGIGYINYDMNELLGLGEFCEVSTCFQFWLNILALFGIDEIAINIGGDNDGGSNGD